MSTIASGNATTRVRLGELLVKAGVITDEQLRAALKEQDQWGGKLGEILVRMQVLSEDVFVRALSKQLGMPRADLSREIPLSALAMVPAEVVEEHEIVPLALQGDVTLVVATADPLNVAALDTVRQVTGLHVLTHVAAPSAVRAAIARLYQGIDAVSSAGAPPDGRTSGMAWAQQSPGSLPPVRPQAGPASVTPNGRPPAAPTSAPIPPIPPIPTPPISAPTVSTAPKSSPLSSTGGAAPGPVSGAPANSPPAASEEPHRRDAAAIKALVELLVQKGVFSLDEYLARLKR
jgi:hypothetical protein